MSVLLALCATANVFGDTSGGIRGRLAEDAPGLRPIADAKVVVVSPSEQRETTTDERGFFVLLNLPPDYYEVMVQKYGYTAPVHPVCIGAGVVQDVKLVASRLKILWRLVEWNPSAPNASRTIDAYDVVGDRHRPC